MFWLYVVAACTSLSALTLHFRYGSRLKHSSVNYKNSFKVLTVSHTR